LGAGPPRRPEGRRARCLALLRVGVAMRRRVAARPVGSYPTFSPLPPWPREFPGGSAVCFLWPCPRVAPSGCYPAPCPAGARTFLRPGFPGPRPPGLL